MRWAGVLLALALVLAGARGWHFADAAEPGVGPVAVRVDPVPLFADETGQRTLGKLKYRGGVRLIAGDARFGGWSDLRVSDDGRGITMISDHGYWLQARLTHDPSGNLAGIENARIGPLIDTRGRPVVGRLSDSEGLAFRPDGSAVVSFEGAHRLWLYAPAEPPFSRPPIALTAPHGNERLPSNGGLEALTSLPNGNLLALAEELYDGDDHVGWIGDGKTWSRLTYRAASDHKPTALAALPNGDVLVLERRFSLFGGFGARLARVKAADVAGGRRLTGQELARFDSPVTVDNFEGVAVARGARGETLIYIVSDDNYQRLLQQTLLMMFELTD